MRISNLNGIRFSNLNHRYLYLLTSITSKSCPWYLYLNFQLSKNVVYRQINRSHDQKSTTRFRIVTGTANSAQTIGSFYDVKIETFPYQRLNGCGLVADKILNIIEHLAVTCDGVHFIELSRLDLANCRMCVWSYVNY